MFQLSHKKIHIAGDYRIIVISDIHSHLDRFIQLLHKVHYDPEYDYLVILGDFVEKGDQALETLHYIQELDQNKKVFVLLGNCEWALKAMLELEEFAKDIPTYFKRVDKNGLVRDTYKKLSISSKTENWLSIQRRIRDALKEELDYISRLPLSLKVNEEFLFVHAGIDKVGYESCSLSSLLEMQDFYYRGHNLDLDVVIGHIPTSNFRNTIDNSILINKKERMIGIDGGTGVKPISQLNAFIITKKNNHITYKKEYVRNYPIIHAIKDIQVQNNPSHKISYPNFEVEVLEKGNEFSKCIRISDHQTINIKNEFLYTRNNKAYCLDDYTDHLLNTKKGQKIEICGVYGSYIYGILNNELGWIEISNTDYKEGNR